MNLLETMKREHPGALAQRQAEIAKQGGETRGTTIPNYETGPTPAPDRRFPGDSDVTGEYRDQRFIGDDDEDDLDSERSEQRRPHDAGMSPGETEGGSLAKSQARTGLVGTDAEVLKMEDEVFAIQRERRELHKADTGAPAVRSRLRKTARDLDMAERKLTHTIALRKSVGAQRAQANHRDGVDGVRNTGPLPAQRPFGLHA